MADYCGGAGGRARASSPAVTYLVGAVAVAVAVETLGLSAIWADLIAYAAGQTFSPSSGCVAPPPEMPNFTDDDVTQIVMSNPIAHPVAWGKLADLVHIGAWLTFCECLPPALITPPAAPIYPSGGPVLNPPSVPGLTAGACWDRATSVNFPVGTNPSPVSDLSPQLLPQSGVPVTVSPLSGYSTLAYPVPAGANNITLTGNPSQSDSCGSMGLYFFSSATGHPLIDFQQLAWNRTGGPQTFTLPLPPSGAAYWVVVGDACAIVGFPPQTWAYQLTYFCTSTAPGLPAPDCCPPDPILMAQLQVIINLLNGLQIGSSPPPLTALVETAVHSGLHDGGSILLRGDTIWVKVTITTDNPALPVGAGVPPYLFSRGFIVPIALEGPIRTNVRLVYNPQLYELPPLADSIGYQLGVGIIATLTELRAGP
jgi:hypothetical protein